MHVRSCQRLSFFLVHCGGLGSRPVSVDVDRGGGEKGAGVGWGLRRKPFDKLHNECMILHSAFPVHGDVVAEWFSLVSVMLPLSGSRIFEKQKTKQNNKTEEVKFEFGP